jgi:hypothetical protein
MMWEAVIAAGIFLMVGLVVLVLIKADPQD